MRKRRQGNAVRSVLVSTSLLALVLMSGCDRREANEYASVESALYAMFDAFALIDADPQSAWAFLGPDTRARLELLADEGPQGLEPTDYLRFGWLPDPALVRSIERTDGGGRYANLRIETELDERFEIELMRAGRGWQVELGAVSMAIPDEHPEEHAHDEDQESDE